MTRKDAIAKAINLVSAKYPDWRVGMSALADYDGPYPFNLYLKPSHATPDAIGATLGDCFIDAMTLAEFGYESARQFLESA